MKIRAPIKILVGFLAIVVGGYYGWQLYAGVTVDSLQFPPIKPARVNIVGVSADSGYTILVANHAAQLIKGKVGSFEGGSGPEGGDAEEKKREKLEQGL